mmetsp:Transcript_6629/g.20706  ORF Transcript_6629/g.20706 Transcript_6629/m.20706 type:complete len:479 (-) Transcript_6629:45-1481(-)
MAEDDAPAATRTQTLVPCAAPVSCVQVRMTKEMVRLVEASSHAGVVGFARFVSASKELSFSSDDGVAWRAAFTETERLECYRPEGPSTLVEVGPVVGRCLARPTALDAATRSEVRRSTDLARELATERKTLTIAPSLTKKPSSPAPPPPPPAGDELLREKTKRPRHAAETTGAAENDSSYVLLRDPRRSAAELREVPALRAVGSCLLCRSELAAAWQKSETDLAEHRVYAKFASSSAAAKNATLGDVPTPEVRATIVALGVDFFDFGEKNGAPPPLVRLVEEEARPSAALRRSAASRRRNSTVGPENNNEEGKRPDSSWISKPLTEVAEAVFACFADIDVPALAGSLRRPRPHLRYEPQPTLDLDRATAVFREWSAAHRTLRRVRLLLEVSHGDLRLLQTREKSRVWVPEVAALELATSLGHALDLELDLLANVLYAARDDGGGHRLPDDLVAHFAFDHDAPGLLLLRGGPSSDAAAA